MAKVKQAATETTGGCLVVGTIKKTDGSPSREKVVFSPAHGGIYDGSFISAAPVVVIPDASGKISIKLPPSVVMGPYSVRFHGQSRQVEIPDRAEVDLQELMA